MDTESLDRIDHFIQLADLEHQIEIASGAGDGNREFEQTKGALEALKEARETLAQDDDPTEKQVVGHIIRNLIRLRIFGIPIPGRIKGFEYLHIGDMNELPNDKDVEYQVIDQITGTRIQVLQAFLDRQKRKL